MSRSKRGCSAPRTKLSPRDETSNVLYSGHGPGVCIVLDNLKQLRGGGSGVVKDTCIPMPPDGLGSERHKGGKALAHGSRRVTHGGRTPT